MKRVFMAMAGVLLIASFVACGSSNNNNGGNGNGSGDVIDNGGNGGGGDAAIDNGGGDVINTCGNGTCDQGEDANNCPADCQAGGPVCGNGTCEQGENASNCPQDCQAGGPVCGNGTCEQGEDANSCPADCQGGGGPVCGNGTCEQGEDANNCPADCKSSGPVCGNGTCEEGENANSCPADCKSGSDKYDCKGYASCVNNCAQGDQACQANCQNSSTPQAVQDFGSLVQCIQKNCAGISDKKKYSQCIDANCMDEYINCFSGDTYQKCTDLVSCLNGCPKDDPSTPNVDESKACLGNCWGESTPQAQKDLNGLIKCANGKCSTECDDSQPNYDKNACNKCFNDALFSQDCKSFTDKCFQHGNDTCGQILRCMNACPADDPTTADKDEQKECINNCYGQGTFDDQNQFGEWQQCAVDACKTQCQDTQSQACNQCWNQVLSEGGSCHDKYQACVDDIPTGDQHCKESWTCLMGAKTKPDANNCWYNATKDAQDQMNKILDCASNACKDKCSDPTSKECNDCFSGALDTQNGACKDDINTCMSDANS